MPTPNNFYPAISTLLPDDFLPEQFAFIKDGLEEALKKVFYKNLQVQKSKDGDLLNASIKLLSYGKIGFEFPGSSGIELVLNPSIDSEEYSEIPLSISVQIGILKYLKKFNYSSFGEDPQGWFNIIVDFLNIEKIDLLQGVLESFIDEDDYLDQFVTNYNDKRPGSPITLNEDIGNEYDILEDLINQIGPGLLYVVIFEDFILSDNFSQSINNIDKFLTKWTGNLNTENFKQLFVPKLKASTFLNAAIVFPRKFLKPIDEDGNVIYDPLLPEESQATSKLTFHIGTLSFDSDEGFTFENLSDFDFSKSLILDSGFSLGFTGAKVDLSQKTNIPEADADGRPKDFIGVYITEGSIGFPANWNHDDGASTAELFVNNLLVGTGGISGTIGLRSKTPATAADPEADQGLIQVKFGDGFVIGLKGFDLTFQQNAIISSNIHGFMQIPGFQHEDGSPAEIDIEIHIGQDGEFNIVVKSDQPLKKIRVPDAFTFSIESLFFGRETGDDGRFYIGIGGELDFTLNEQLGQFLPDKIDIEKMLIYDDGEFEFEGGKLTLPKAISLSFGPAKLSITGIHLGSYEKADRKYKFFGFDGGVKVNPGGVEAHGKGIKYYYTVDHIDPFKWFIGLESLNVDIIIPSGADPEKAAVAIQGWLSISEPKIPPVPDPDPNPGLTEVLKNSQEYIGGVSVSIPKFKGLKGSAAMRLNPKVPAFIVDLGIELSTPIVLGATGLGIYGFRGLLGKKYVATKFAAGVPEDGEWWQYYKAKIDPDYHQGIQVSKFSTKNGFSFGAGVSLATASDSGKIFSSKLFFLLSLPDVFLFQGQAQFLKERIGIDSNPDPPFFAIIAITNKSIEAGFGVNYKLRDEGKIVTVDGLIELGFFWGDSHAWYINVGRETPDDRRIQARLFDILNMYFYLMLSNNGIRLGAGVKFELKKTFGPLSAELKAYIDTFGKISRRPKQIGGALKMGGSVSLKICGLGFSVSGGATLAGEAPKPHIVTGEFEVCVKVLKKERCARFELTWTKDEELDQTRVPLLVGEIGDSGEVDPNDVNKVAGSSHMISKERFAIASRILNNDIIPDPDIWINDGSSIDDYRIPMDSFIDIEFKKGMNVSSATGINLDKIGGQSGPSQCVEFVPPIRGKSDRTRHEYYFKKINIFYWNEVSNAWEDYDFYNALLPIYDNASGTLANAIDSSLLEDFKWGYWQQQQPGVNNKLRILATTPLSYTSSTGDSLNIEDMGINSSTIFCPTDPISMTCVTFDIEDLYMTFAQNTIRTYENINFRITDADGVVLNAPYTSLDNGLIIPYGHKLEIFFNESMKQANLLLSSSAPHMVLKYYRRVMADGWNYGLTSYDYELIDTKTIDGGYSSGIDYTCGDDGGIDYITVEPNSCSLTGTITVSVPDQSSLLASIKTFLNTLIKNHQLTATSVELSPAYADDYADFLLSGLYNGNGHVVNLTQTSLTPTNLSFRITDDAGFDCFYNFDLFSEVYKFDYTTIVEVKDIVMYTADDAIGENNNFKVIFNLDDNSSVEFIGSTCKALSYTFDRCATGFYKVCYLSLEDYLTNQSIPQEDYEHNNMTMMESINKTLQPVWRPNTTYAIQVKTEDRLFRESAPVPFTSYTENVVYGFRTAGPIGHFHQYPVIESSEEKNQDRADYGALAAQGKENEFRLNNLRSYIDYSKSYPNADGQLINAKPLFYNNAELRLFYLYNYVYQFYTDWVDYANSSEENVLKIAESSLEVVILNPAPSETPEENISEGFEANSIVRNAVLGQPPGLINEVNHEISILNNLLTNGNSCTEQDPAIPIDLSTKKVMNLKPSKLYTAQFLSKYRPKLEMGLTTEEFKSIVHSYVFQTSRYSSFEEQVNSYILKTNELEEVTLAAVYPLELTNDFDPDLAEKVIKNDLGLQQDALVAQYTDRFDQLINGVFAMDINALQAPVRTEFNLVKRNGQLVGILVRNPEPFNDPKIPVPSYAEWTEDLETLMVYKYDGSDWSNEEDYIAIHSKDKSQIFVTLRSFTFDFDTTSKLKFEFNYKQYNGIAYENASSTDVVLDLTNYTI